MSVLGPLPTPQIADPRGMLMAFWQVWLNQLQRLALALGDAGPTTSRPTTNLYVGRMYFDATLGYPVWLKSMGPSVWVNATGTPV